MFASQQQIRKTASLFFFLMIHFPLFFHLSMTRFFLFPLFCLRRACVGEWLSPTAQIHPTRVGQPAHLPLTHLRCWNLHLHGKQLQRHWRSVCWPSGLGWGCRDYTDKAFHILLKTHMVYFMSSKCPWNPSHSFLCGEKKGTYCTVVEFYLEACLFSWGLETRSSLIIIKLHTLPLYTKEHFCAVPHWGVFCKKQSRNILQNSSMSFQQKWVF